MNSKENKLQLKEKQTQLEKIRIFEIEKLMMFAKQEVMMVGQSP